jgi:hypothetical protein
MDRSLAEFYNTQENLGVLGGGYTGEDLQKQAAAEFLVKLAAEEGVDLNSLSDVEVGQLLAEVEGNMGKTASAPAPTAETEMQEKLAESDYLGRAMAHAYVDELASIEKQAKEDMIGPQISSARLGYRRATEAVKKLPGQVGEATGVSKIRGGLSKVLKAGHGVIGGPDVESHARGLAREVGKKELTEGLKRFGKRVAAPAAGLALAGGVAHHYLKKDKEKKSADEQFEAAALERAQEMLAEAGYEKQAEDVGTQVEIRALQMLEEAGYPVQWNQ